jgi:hypothetical protein
LNDEEETEFCYIDECVDKGTYRYGFAVPYECDPTGCMVNYFQPIEVKESSAGCVRLKDTQPPEVYTTGVPWKDNVRICPQAGSGGCSIFSNGPATVYVMNLLALAIGFLLYLRRKKVF